VPERPSQLAWRVLIAQTSAGSNDTPRPLSAPRFVYGESTLNRPNNETEYDLAQTARVKLLMLCSSLQTMIPFVMAF
jgi:hypothetical protein